MLLTFLAILLLYVFSIATIGCIIFSPLIPIAGREPLEGARYQLTDLLAFYFPLQLGFAALNFLFPDIRWNFEIGLGAVLCLLLLSGLSWFYGMRILWRSNTASPLKRIALLGIAMPFGFIVPTLALPILIGFGGSVIVFFVKLIVLASVVVLLRGLLIWTIGDSIPLPKQVVE